jgi:N-acetylneuraminate lyase
MKPFRLYSAPPTPFDEHGEVRLSSIEPLAEHLVKTGVTGVFVCGTTGESASLSAAERQAVALRWVEVAGNHLQVLVHVGHTAHKEAAELARHARQIGAHGVSSVAPYYFKPATTHDLLNWLEPVAAAAGDLPFYYYYIPSMTGVSLPVAPLLRAGRERIPNLAGAKFTSENLADFAACQEAMPEGTLFFGRDEILLAALSLHARAAVGATYTLLAPLFRDLLRAYDSGHMELAREKQSRASHAIAVLGQFGGLVAIKALLTRQGIPHGEPRPPLTRLAVEQRAALFSAWDEAMAAP